MKTCWRSASTTAKALTRAQRSITSQIDSDVGYDARVVTYVLLSNVIASAFFETVPSSEGLDREVGCGFEYACFLRVAISAALSESFWALAKILHDYVSNLKSKRRKQVKQDSR